MASSPGDEVPPPHRAMSYSDAAAGVVNPPASRPDIEEDDDDEPRVVVLEVDDETGEETLLMDEAISVFMRNDEEEEKKTQELEFPHEDVWVSVKDATLRRFALSHCYPVVYMLAYVPNSEGGFSPALSTNDAKLDDGETAFWREKAPKLENLLNVFLKRLKHTPETLTPETPISVDRAVLAKLIKLPRVARELLTSDDERIDAYLGALQKRRVVDGRNEVAVPRVMYDDFVVNGPRNQCLSVDDEGRLFVVPANELEELLAERTQEHYIPTTFVDVAVTTTPDGRKQVLSPDDVGDMGRMQQEILDFMRKNDPSSSSSSPIAPVKSGSGGNGGDDDDDEPPVEEKLSRNQRRRRRKKATSITAE